MVVYENFFYFSQNLVSNQRLKIFFLINNRHKTSYEPVRIDTSSHMVLYQPLIQLVTIYNVESNFLSNNGLSQVKYWVVNEQ